MHRCLITVIVLLGLAGRASGSVDWTPVTDPIGDYVDGRPEVEGAGLLLADFDGNVLHEQYWGGYDRRTSIPIASATKWWSAAATMTAVDAGWLSLDTRVADVLPVFAGADDGRGEATLAQLFSHTSGMKSSSSLLGRGDISLATAVALLGMDPTLMESEPGEAFAYGGVSMHVAGRMVESAAGQAWVDWFEATLVTPLNVADTDFNGLGGGELNPRIAGGMRTSVDAYASFLDMLVNRGRSGGEQVLSEASVEAMFVDRTFRGSPDAVRVDFTPPSLPEFLGHGLGSWVMRRTAAGEAVEFASPGAFGTYPWIDFENEYVGIFLIDSQNAQTIGLVDAVRAFAAERIDPPLPGDANRDGRVDLSDFLVLRSNFGRQGDVRFGDGDFDRSGTIDLSDFLILRRNFGNRDGPSHAPLSRLMIPEPAATGTLVLAAATLARRRRSGSHWMRGEP
jgi:CubicO group peptidase (beta-lactamase class C family)